MLATEIRHFEAVDDGGPDLKVELVIQSSLIHQRSARAIATRTVRQEVDSSGKTLDPLIAAFESALAGLIGGGLEPGTGPAPRSLVSARGGRGG